MDPVKTWTPEHLAMARERQALLEDWRRSGVPFNESRHAAQIKQLSSQLREALGDGDAADFCDYGTSPDFVPSAFDCLMSFVECESRDIADMEAWRRQRDHNAALAGVKETARALNQWQHRDPDAEFIAYIQTLKVGEELPPRMELEHFGHGKTMSRRLERLSHPATGWLKKVGHGKYVRSR